MKALIVDDDVFVRKCLIQMLPWRELDFSQVLEADNGADALDIAMREKVDLVITDVKMPQLDGLELSTRLSRNMLDICILLLSEHSDFEFAQRAIKCGVHDYILKPLTSERLNEICDKIRQATEEMQMRRYYTALKIDKSSVRDVIREMLESMDAQAIQDAFDHLAANKIHRDDLKSFGLMFLTELFDQTEAMTFSKGEVQALRTQLLDDYARVKNVTDLRALVQTACAKCYALSMNGSTMSTSHVQKMVNYIDTHYMDPDLSVAQVSEWLHLSPIYTGALFKKCNGKSIVSYIHEVRIEQAKKLLLDASINVKEVSTRVGYMTPDYFTRIFNMSVGVTPSKYRAMILEKTREDAKANPA